MGLAWIEMSRSGGEATIPSIWGLVLAELVMPALGAGRDFNRTLLVCFHLYVLQRRVPPVPWFALFPAGKLPWASVFSLWLLLRFCLFPGFEQFGA